MNLENIIPSESTQSQKDTHGMILEIKYRMTMLHFTDPGGWTGRRAQTRILEFPLENGMEQSVLEGRWREGIGWDRESEGEWGVRGLGAERGRGNGQMAMRRNGDLP